MSLRRQLPVYSPLTLRALFHGARSLLSGDRELDHFRAWLGTRFEARGVLLADSGTSALALAVRSSSPDRPRVGLPAWGCFDLATAMEGARAKVALYDLDAETLSADEGSYSRALESGLDSLVLVHSYGFPADLDRLQAIAAGSGALIIEDAAQGTGGEWNGRALGSFGDLSVLSFGRGKGLTGGGGGALLAHTDRGLEALSSAAASLSGDARGAGVLIRSLAQWLLARPALFAIPASIPFLRLGETLHHPPHVAGPISSVSVGLLTVTSQLVDRETEVRRVNAERLLGAISPGGVQPIRRLNRGRPGFLRLPVIAGPAWSRFTGRPARALGITPGYPRPLADLPGFSDFMTIKGDWPGARALSRSLVTLPVHSLLTEADLRAMEHMLRDVAA